MKTGLGLHQRRRRRKGEVGWKKGLCGAAKSVKTIFYFFFLFPPLRNPFCPLPKEGKTDCVRSPSRAITLTRTRDLSLSFSLGGDSVFPLVLLGRMTNCLLQPESIIKGGLVKDLFYFRLLGFQELRRKKTKSVGL